jgi:hypothetical protein
MNGPTMKKLAIFIVILAIAGTVGVWIAYNRLKSQPRESRPPVGATPSLPVGAVYSLGPLPIENWRLSQHEKLKKELGEGPKQILVISGPIFARLCLQTSSTTETAVSAICSGT